MRLPAFLLLLSLPCVVCAAQETLRIAVAASFRPTLDKIAARFESAHPVRCRISAAATGALYAQIVNGADFDLLLAADERVPAELVGRGLVREADRLRYARGTLILIGREPALPGATTAQVAQLLADSRGRIALANPDTAPYGLAARRTLEALGLWHSTRSRRVTGQSAAQVLQFFLSGNVDYAFVSLGQWHNGGAAATHYYWTAPAAPYPPLWHEAVLLTRSAQRPAARDFFDFLAGAQARQLLRADGYEVDP